MHIAGGTDLDSEPQDGSDYEFDVHGLTARKPLLPSSHHGGSGTLWYRHPVNIGLLCVAVSVFVMVIVSGLYAWSRWKHSRSIDGDKRIDIHSENTPLLLPLRSERTEDAFDLDEHEQSHQSTTPNARGASFVEGLVFL